MFVCLFVGLLLLFLLAHRNATSVTKFATLVACYQKKEERGPLFLLT